MRWWTCILLVLCGIAAGPATRPTTRPAVDETEVLRLVALLADADAGKRDDAAAKLRRIGKAAIPMLQRAIESGDPEWAGRAKNVIERINANTLPGGLPADGVTFSELTMTGGGGDGNVKISGTFDGRKVVLTQGETITMAVTGLQDGKEVTVEFKAEDAEKLREQSTEAHDLYQRITASMRIVNGQVILGAQPLAQEPMDILRRSLEGQMEEAGTPRAKRAEVLAEVAKLRTLRVTDRDETDEVRDKKLKEFFESSDRLRKTLAELNLDAGNLLPPPPNARLGVQLTVLNDGLQIEKVVAGSRGDKIGLRPGDYIKRVNLKDIRDINELKAALAAARGSINVEVVRDQKSVMLEEKK